MTKPTAAANAADLPKDRPTLLNALDQAGRTRRLVRAASMAAESVADEEQGNALVEILERIEDEIQSLKTILYALQDFAVGRQS